MKALLPAVSLDDDGNQYYIFYLGELPDIFEEDTIGVYGLPLSMSRFANTGGGTTLCPVLAGSWITAVE